MDLIDGVPSIRFRNFFHRACDASAPKTNFGSTGVWKKNV